MDTISDLQKIKNNYKSFTQDLRTNMSKDTKEITQIRNRNLAIDYINLATKNKVNKTDFCKRKHISINSLNNGIKSLGVKITHKSRMNGNNGTNEAILEPKTNRKSNKRKVSTSQMAGSTQDDNIRNILTNQMLKKKNK